MKTILTNREHNIYELIYDKISRAPLSVAVNRNRISLVQATEFLNLFGILMTSQCLENSWNKQIHTGFVYSKNILFKKTFISTSEKLRISSSPLTSHETKTMRPSWWLWTRWRCSERTANWCGCSSLMTGSVQRLFGPALAVWLVMEHRRTNPSSVPTTNSLPVNVVIAESLDRSLCLCCLDFMANLNKYRN